MAVLICWKTGILNVHKTAEQPEGTLVIMTGGAEHLQREMVATSVRAENGVRYIPGMAELPDETPEDERLVFVNAYVKTLAKRIACRTAAGRRRWAAQEASAAR